MKEVQIETHKNNIVCKANDLITAKGFLSGTSQKMLASVISMMRKDDAEFTQYALNRKEYLKSINANSNNDKFLKETAKELMSNPFEINGRIYNWCSEVDFVSRQGYIVFDIHPKLKPFLLELKRDFTEYKVVNILALKGEYTPRLYEYITMKWNSYRGYHKQANSFTFDFPIDEMRSIFKIPNTYKFYDIKRQILEKAVKQFREKTDIQISYKEQKIGRKVDRVIVTVRENGKGSNDYTKSLQAFISYMRVNYINQDIYQGKDKYTGRVMKISIAPDGKLYDKKGFEFDAKRSKEMWQSLFELAQKDMLLCLKQGTLF